MVCEDSVSGAVVAVGEVFPDLAGVSCWPAPPPPPPQPPCSSLLPPNTMTVVSSYCSDVVSVVVGERGVVGGYLLTAMSGVEAPPPPEAAPSPPTAASASAAHPPAADKLRHDAAAAAAPPPTGRGRRKLENEDSSYDSDFEPCERSEEDEHEDVCRTVSDTLGAEFAEYVTEQGSTATTGAAATTTATPPPPPSASPSPTATTTVTTTTAAAASSTTTATTAAVTAGPDGKATPARAPSAAPSPPAEKPCPSAPPPSVSVTPPAPPAVTPPQPPPPAAGVSWVVQRPSYASQVEFGVKLGYSETLVQLALVKLGGTPDKDELLAELIRLGTNAPRADGDADAAAADDAADAKEEPEPQPPALKPVIIDGSNVAMSHGNKTTFSCRGLRVCVDWFRARGHAEILVFVPSWRKEAPRWDTPIADQEILLELERERVLVFTPSRVCGGKRIVSYDDRYILKEAVASGGVVVSNDNYRDLAAESQPFRRVIEESLLMYSWVKGRFVPPDDPLGRSGPTLDAFLRRSPRDRQAPCPYGRKCTYGNKCKYMHPERGAAPVKSVTERLQEQAQRHHQNKAKSRDSSPGEGLRDRSLSLPVGIAESDVAKEPLVRTRSIVPSVSLTLPSALTQETPTHDRGPATTTAASSHSHRHVMPPHLESRPLDALCSSTLFKSDSSLYRMYPSQTPQSGFGSSPWGWSDLSMRPQGAPPQSQPSGYGSRMPLAKQVPDSDAPASDNPHRKLQRQLTLNPAYDARLYKIVGFREPAPEHFPLAGSVQQQQQQAAGQGSPNRSLNREGEALVFSQVASGMTGRVSPGYSSPYGSREQLPPSGIHPPLARHSSQDGAKHMASLPPHLYPTYSHPHVTRFASAPDPIWGGQQQQQQQAAAGPPQITRLNSTSDTRLNVYAGSDSHFFSDVFDDQMGRLPPFHPVGPQHSASPGPGAPSPGPIGSRPMSPQQGPVLHQSPSVSPRQHTPPRQRQQQQQQQAAAAGGLPSAFPGPTAAGAAGHEDARLRIFYHLSNLFPEAQVRAVLAVYPDETDPLKICSCILTRNPGPVGSRPMSPQQPPPSGVPQASGSGSSSSSSPSPLAAGFGGPPASSHEDARLRAFYHLSQLFPEAQVRAVLARYPDETDAHHFCATLLSRSGGAGQS